MMLVGTNANDIFPIPVDGRNVPGNFGLQFRKLGKNQINYRPKGLSFVGSFSEAEYSSTELNFGSLRERGWSIVLRFTFCDPLDSRPLSSAAVPAAFAVGVLARRVEGESPLREPARRRRYGRRYGRDLQ